ncbi:hypothetical protein HML84_07130 [Alcanivorax sp. IO_7]|nr:hypothetical protein HML84_07130 [Alcanivorax sp. IO_7]
MPKATAGTGPLQGRLTLAGTPDDLAVTHDLSAPARLRSAGRLGYRDSAVQLDLTHTWPAQDLPVGTPVPVSLGEGRLTTRGNLDRVDLDGAADLTADGHPIRVELAGQAGLSDARLTRLAITSDQQTLTLQGNWITPTAWPGTCRPAAAI